MTYVVPLSLSRNGPWQELEQRSRRRSMTDELTKVGLDWQRMRISRSTTDWLGGSISLLNRLTRWPRASELLSLKEFPIVRITSATVPTQLTLTWSVALILLIWSPTSLEEVLMARKTWRAGTVVWYNFKQSNSCGKEGSSNWKEKSKLFHVST